MSEEEKKQLEREFQYALDNIISKIKGETATAIVQSEQSMILLFKKIMFQLDKQQKEIEELNEIKQQICKEELITQDYVQENFIKKDKIREKIKELQAMSISGDIYYTDIEKMFYELLEE